MCLNRLDKVNMFDATMYTRDECFFFLSNSFKLRIIKRVKKSFNFVLLLYCYILTKNQNTCKISIKKNKTIHF